MDDELKKVVVVAFSEAFRKAITEQLNCSQNNIAYVYSPEELLSLVKVTDPQLVILDYDAVEQDNLMSYYNVARWYEIQLIITNQKNRLDFRFLLS